MGGAFYPTQVHIQIIISRYSYCRLTGSNDSVGSALARFERSPLPRHNGTRTVVLRYLKIITPVECVIPRYNGHIVQPEEGEYHRRFPQNTQNFFKKDPLVWSVDIDKGLKLRGLQLLWDATDIMLSK
jgi:hypothetical protein